jgi:hypothetical protein
MRRIYLASILVATGAVSYGWTARDGRVAVQGETFASRFVDAASVDADRRLAQFDDIKDPSVRAEASRGFEALRSVALRFAIMELLPAELTQLVTDPSASPGAVLEGITAAAVEPVAPAEATLENSSLDQWQAARTGYNSRRDHQSVDQFFPPTADGLAPPRGMSFP